MSPRPLLLTALLALVVSATAPAQQPASPTAAAVKTVEFESKSVGRKLKYNVALPEKYEATTDRYPVLYLLHGYTSNYTAWARLAVPKFAREYDLIVVMPDAGNSWYANWAQSDEGQKNDWEDYLVKDLIGHVDATYRTIATRDGRAINGLSMGGYGALMIGLKHPDLFCSIGSHSGAVAFAKSASERLRSGDDLTKAKVARKLSDAPNPAIGIEGFSSQVERSPKGKLFATAEQADAYDPFKLVLNVPKEKLPHIYIDCGTDDRLLKSNQDLVKLLMENKVPFTYAESPGGHNGAYWSREVGHSMAVQYHVIRRNLARAAGGSAAGAP
jgi:S-formylglutathione hydrolase FrmB